MFQPVLTQPNPNLSDRQRATLTFIQTYGADQGFPPTIREIGAALGITSTSLVQHHLLNLEKKGWIQRAPSASRAIRLLHPLHPADTAH